MDVVAVGDGGLSGDEGLDDRALVDNVVGFVE